jgi:hypothetical protein
VGRSGSDDQHQQANAKVADDRNYARSFQHDPHARLCDENDFKTAGLGQQASTLNIAPQERVEQARAAGRLTAAGGDGASFAVPATDAALARQALAETATWVKEDLDLSLRIGMVSVADIRTQGRDVRVARDMPSANVSIAMFSGGGMTWANAAMQRGQIAVPPAAPGAHPDLSGLSCRYELIPSQRGQVLSLVVMPGAGANPDDFRAVVEAVTRIVEKTPDA